MWARSSYGRPMRLKGVVVGVEVEVVRGGVWGGYQDCFAWRSFCGLVGLIDGVELISVCVYTKYPSWLSLVVDMGSLPFCQTERSILYQLLVLTFYFVPGYPVVAVYPEWKRLGKKAYLITES